MITTCEFGRTGHQSSRIIFGAAGLWDRAWGQEWASALLDSVVEAGVNHIDTAASYGDSELLLAPWLARNRSRVFLGTKTDQRRGADARAQLELSLERLGVDSVDLVQLHNLVEDDEWQVAHRTDGALAAMVTAREEGLVGHIGVTGHGTRIARMHLRSLDEFDYASVLVPYNRPMLMNDAYRADIEELLDRCAERHVAVQTIKSIARRRWPDEDADVDERRSWYQPLRDPDAIRRSMQYVLANDQLFVNTSSDTRLMSEMTTAATELLANGPVLAPSDEALASDHARFDMAPLFDGDELEVI